MFRKCQENFRFSQKKVQLWNCMQKGRRLLQFLSYTQKEKNCAEVLANQTFLQASDFENLAVVIFTMHLAMG